MSSGAAIVVSAQSVLQDLIRFDTVSHRSNEAISLHVTELLEKLGFQVETTSYADRRETRKFNLVAKRQPIRAEAQVSDATIPATQDPTGGLAYFCHTDVVPADRWTGPGGIPFEPVVQNERMYGRGTCDMKGSLAAMLQAAASVSVSDQTSPLWIVCSADEEVGFEGAKHLVQHSDAYQEITRADPVSIIGEPTELSVVHAHKGITGLRIRSIGKAAHSSTGLGLNANAAMVPMMDTLLEIDRQCRTNPSLRDDRFDPPTLTWNFGVSDGMKSVNIVPDECIAWACFRTMPGVDGSDLIETVQQRADDLGLTVQHLFGGDPLETPVDTPCVQTFCELAEPLIGPNRPSMKCYATDGCVFGQLRQRIVCGPGSIDQAHTTDEFITLEQLEKGATLYESAIRRFCT